jgi:hypothetical protein
MRIRKTEAMKCFCRNNFSQANGLNRIAARKRGTRMVNPIYRIKAT